MLRQIQLPGCFTWFFLVIFIFIGFRVVFFTCVVVGKRGTPRCDNRHTFTWSPRTIVPTTHGLYFFHPCLYTLFAVEDFNGDGVVAFRVVQDIGVGSGGGPQFPTPNRCKCPFAQFVQNWIAGYFGFAWGEGGGSGGSVFGGCGGFGGLCGLGGFSGPVVKA